VLAETIQVHVSGDTVQSGWLTLAAVLVGALITGGFTVGVAWWREGKVAAADRRRHDMEVRRAARLIEDDLHMAVAAAHSTLDDKRWWYGGQTLTWKGWEQYRDVIAPEPESTWGPVAIAVMAMGHLQSARDGQAAIHRAKMRTDPATADEVASAVALGLDPFEPLPTPISDVQVAQIERILRDLEKGRVALVRLMQDKPAA
jgi:hypothetical protein